MNHTQFKTIMPYISSDLIAWIAAKQQITEQEAMMKLYASNLYAMMEQEDMKLWQYSTAMLYALFEQEEKTGRIHFPEV